MEKGVKISLSIGGVALLSLVLPWLPVKAHVAESAESVEPRRLGEVVVTGTRPLSSSGRVTQTVTVIGRDEIENSFQPTLLPLMETQVPGLFITSRGVYGYGVSGGAAGGVAIRGLSGGSGRVMTLIDGHPQYNGIFGHPVSDALQSSIAERVEVVRGPASVIYGSNAMGGVINIITRRPQSDGVMTILRAGYGSYNTLNAEVTNQVRMRRFSSTASVSYNRSDNHRDNMDFGQFNGFAKLGYDISGHWSAHADVDITRFMASNPGAVTAPLLDADQRITRGMASLSVDNRYGVTSGGISAFMNFGHHWINDGYSPASTPRLYRFMSDDMMGGVSAWQSVCLFAGNTVTLGADIFRYSGKAWNKYVEGERKGERQIIADKSHTETAAYIDVRQTISDRVTLNGGIRADYHNARGTEWIPQAGVAVDIPGNIQLKLSASKGFRYPTLREMYMFGPANPDLCPESSWNYELAYAQVLPGGRIGYGVNLFYLNARNLITTVPREGATPLNINTGRVENCGVEVSAYYAMTGWLTADANYSYLHTSRPLLEAPRHKAYAGLRYRKGRWNLSTGLHYVGGLYTVLDGNVTENFLLWNVTGQYGLCRVVKVWLRCDNLFAQRYEINAGYPMPRMTAIAGLKVEF